LAVKSKENHLYCVPRLLSGKVFESKQGDYRAKSLFVPNIFSCNKKPGQNVIWLFSILETCINL
jgi:hypothetical protein